MPDLERMAREAGICMDLWSMGAGSVAFSGTQEASVAGVCRDDLERLEAAIRADEREKWAKVCDYSAEQGEETINQFASHETLERRQQARQRHLH